MEVAQAEFKPTAVIEMSKEQEEMYDEVMAAIWKALEQTEEKKEEDK